MTRISTFLLLALSLNAFGQNFTPAELLNFEFTLDNQVVPYEKVTVLNPSSTRPDTNFVINVQRTFLGAFLSGAEIDYPNKDTSLWVCTTVGNVNTVAVLNPFNPTDTLTKDVFYSDGAGRDTLAISYVNSGNGQLKVEDELEVKYNAQGVSEVFVYEYNGTQRTFLAILSVSRNTNGQADSVLIEASSGPFSMLPLIPVQLYTYAYNQNRLDTVKVFDLLINPNPTQPTELLVMRHNSNNQINRVSAYEKNSISGEFEPYEIYFFTPRADISLTENTLAYLSLSPNPAKNYLSLNNSEVLEVSIYDLSGKLMKHSCLLKPFEKLMVEDLKAGVYHLKAISLQGFKTIKWQKL